MHFFLQDAQLKVSILSIISFHDKGLATNYKEKKYYHEINHARCPDMSTKV